MSFFYDKSMCCVCYSRADIVIMEKHRDHSLENEAKARVVVLWRGSVSFAKLGSLGLIVVVNLYDMGVCPAFFTVDNAILICGYNTANIIHLYLPIYMICDVDYLWKSS